jgi:predicted nuclease of predicted toxin-antitoxin system
MKWIVDAQLPRRIARALQTWGHDADWGIFVEISRQHLTLHQ